MNKYTFLCLVKALELGIHLSAMVIAVNVLINILSGRDSFYGFSKLDKILFYMYTVSVWFIILVGKRKGKL